MKARYKAPRVVVARDCSPILLEGQEEEAWLRRLAAAATPADMLLRMGGGSTENDEPIVSFDAHSGTWCAGRYVGEVQFEGRMLRLEPRFGMPALLRWLSIIWGTRIVGSAGGYEAQQIWLWHLIAHLWAGRLVAAGKHGIPFRRVNSTHYGRSARGRLQVSETALMHATGDKRLASISRERVADPVISDILLAAFGRLRAALGPNAQKAGWLPERARVLLDDLQMARSGHKENVDRLRKTNVRYTPITEGYRPAVDLSLSILVQRPRIPATGAEGRALGVLLDIAEIWELYVAKLLQAGLPGFHVSHTGRTTQHFKWLLSNSTGQKFGSLRPDILVTDLGGRHLAVVDAKYKSTRIHQGRLTGIVTSDLYQIVAYLSGFGDRDSDLHGFLVYPDDEGGQIDHRLSLGNPWGLSSGARRSVSFLSMSSKDDEPRDGFNESEQNVMASICVTIAGQQIR